MVSNVGSAGIVEGALHTLHQILQLPDFVPFPLYVYFCPELCDSELGTLLCVTLKLCCVFLLRIRPSTSHSVVIKVRKFSLGNPRL